MNSVPEVTHTLTEEEVLLVRQCCKCSECALFGSCPNFDYKLTKEDVRYIFEYVKNK